MAEERKSKKQDRRPRPVGGGGLPEGGAGRILIWLILAMTIGFWFWGPLGQGLYDAPRISYSAFREQIEAGNVARVSVQGEEIRGRLVAPAKRQVEGGKTAEYREFVTYVPSFGDDALLAKLEAKGVEVETLPVSQFSFWMVLINALPFLLLIWLGYMFFSRMRSQGQSIFSVGKSRARLYEQRDERTTFGDVAGLQGAKGELQEIVEYLKDPRRIQRLGGKAPKGVLLVGPPGTGKTLLARAVAGEAGVPFFSITGSDFMEMFVGVGASRVRSMFQDAKKKAPSIIFIDELDSIGRRRGAGLGGGHDEREQTLNQMLSELDGFEPNEGVIVMAATNRPDILDPALLRPGRFDRRITVDLPTVQDRQAILKIHARNKPLAEDVDLERLARGMPGSSGADLENILNEAALLAARKDRDRILGADVEAARDKVLLGLEREGLVMTEDECRLVAYHEAGHAVVAAVLPHTDPVHKVSIVPRDRSMGVTQQVPEREMYVYLREYMLDRLAVMMGGRAAEALVLESASSGAESDLKEATRLARKMVLDWGMSERLGHMAFGDGREQVFLGEEFARRREYSEATAQAVDEEVRSILKAAYERATGALEKHREALDLMAETLLEKEEIGEREVLEIVGVKSEEAYGLTGRKGEGEEVAEVAGEEPSGS